jgi:hypothetical protein
VSARKTGRQRSDAERTAIVLIYGENLHDTKAIGELVEALAPAWERRVRPRRSPPVEIKNTPIAELPQRRDRIAAAIAVERAARGVLCVFAHEDCDAVEPAHRHVCERIEKTLSTVGCPAYAVAPAWELEAWWFQWPEAVRASNPSWRSPDDYLGRSVGKMRNPKERLQRAVVPTGMKAAQKANFRSYRESDSPRIAQLVRERGEAMKPQAKSESYEWFVHRVKKAQAAH